MSLTSSESELLAQFQLLPPASQQILLSVAKSLQAQTSQGTPRSKLLELAGCMSPEDAAEMTAAIEEEFGQIPGQSKRQQGSPLRDYLRFAGTIDPEDLKRMSNAIEEGCEQIDESQW